METRTTADDRPHPCTEVYHEGLVRLAAIPLRISTDSARARSVRPSQSWNGRPLGWTAPAARPERPPSLSPGTAAGRLHVVIHLFLRDGDRFLELEAHDAVPAGMTAGSPRVASTAAVPAPAPTPAPIAAPFPPPAMAPTTAPRARADRHPCRVFLLSGISIHGERRRGDGDRLAVRQGQRLRWRRTWTRLPSPAPPDRTKQSGLTRRRPWMRSPSRHRRWARPAWRQMARPSCWSWWTGSRRSAPG